MRRMAPGTPARPTIKERLIAPQQRERAPTPIDPSQEKALDEMFLKSSTQHWQTTDRGAIERWNSVQGVCHLSHDHCTAILAQEGPCRASNAGGCGTWKCAHMFFFKGPDPIRNRLSGAQASCNYHAVHPVHATSVSSRPLPITAGSSRVENMTLEYWTTCSGVCILSRKQQHVRMCGV